MFLSPCSDVQKSVVTVFNAELPEGLNITHTLTNTLPGSLNLLMRLSTAGGGIFIVLVILCLGTFFWNWSTIFRHSFSQITSQRTSAHLYIWEALNLWNAPILHSHVTDLLPVNLFSCQTLLHLFCSTFCCQLFWNVFLRSKSKWAHIFHEMLKCFSFNIWCIFMFSQEKEFKTTNYLNNLSVTQNS